MTLRKNSFPTRLKRLHGQNAVGKIDVDSKKYIIVYYITKDNIRQGIKVSGNTQIRNTILYEKQIKIAS